MKKTVYFNEYNIRMGEFSYLPIVSGLLRAYAETFFEIKENFEFMPFIYEIDTPENILKKYTKPPDIAAFSSSMWNEQLNYCIASAIKTKYPDCLIIFGGPNVPMPPQHNVEEWMLSHSYIDIAVRAEGEEAFADILKAYLKSKEFNSIPGVACQWHNKKYTGLFSFCYKERSFKRDLSEIPSPYLKGLYDYLLDFSKETGHKFQAIIETNRGCPFPCTFCYWGRGGLSRKYRYHDMDRIFAEIDWMGRNNIVYVFNADSNFGMNDRDQKITDFIVKTKQKYGYPDKFRTCFGKNTDDKIFKIGTMLHANKLEKGITLARQSNNLEVLKNIRRNNIKMSTYQNLQKRFNDSNVPVYGELILGLPGETVQSWMQGVDELLEAGTKNQLYVYLCQIFPNTEMAEDVYQKKFGIQTKTIKLAEIHGQVRPSNFIQEYEEIIIQTNSMLLEDWKKSLKFSYVLMLFHSLKIAYYVMIYILDQHNLKMSKFIEFIADKKYTNSSILDYELNFYDELIKRMIEKGEHRGTILSKYSNFYWDVEEASFLRITENTDEFYNQLLDVVRQYLISNNIQYNEELLLSVIQYQKIRIPNQKEAKTNEFIFEWNLPEYFDKRFNNNYTKLIKQRQAVTIDAVYSSAEEFAKKNVLWGRRSGTLLTEIR